MITDATINIKNINKKMFLDMIPYAKSICGHPEIAEHLSIKLNRESITLHQGDVLYIVLPASRPNAGQRVEDGAKYKFISEDEGYVYKMITVLNETTE